jgi:phosphatidylserine/phosphatidylglycerophosphate/cardiolipin synthase-like enzyme
MQVRVPSSGFSPTGISVNAIAGTNVVFFGIDASPSARTGLLGFAVRRIDHTEAGQPGADRWLSGRKVFKSVVPAPDANKEYETRLHPIQSFVWSDYRAKPGYSYTYFVHAMYGTPAAPQLAAPVEISVRTEASDDAGAHAVFFNRGAIASQAFSLKFPELADKDTIDLARFDNPKDVATVWLSRGLLEAALAFINSTTPDEKLRVAAYEFSYAPILLALKDAHDRGVDVRIVYEAGTVKKDGKIKDTSATASAKDAIEHHQIPASILIKRTKRAAIPHNKFIVKLRRNGAGKHVPVEVWTGSANFTMSGFLGQANCGHLVRDSDVAKTFLAYWTALSGDPVPDKLKTWVMKETPNPAAILPSRTTVLFSPRKDSKMLAWYAARVAEARSAVFFTAAFGLNPDNNKLHAQVMEKADAMRYVLLEKPDAEANKLHKTDTGFLAANGAGLGMDSGTHDPLPGWKLASWFPEFHFRDQGNVFYVHLKFLLLDPLGDDPVVISGSANFSPNSLLGNDENMLLIRGDKRVAHSYFTEFDRLFRHFSYRDAANDGGAKNADKGKFLIEGKDWTLKDFKKRSFHDRRRRMLAGG